jgi:hypothetical protein
VIPQNHGKHLAGVPRVLASSECGGVGDWQDTEDQEKNRSEPREAYVVSDVKQRASPNWCYRPGWSADLMT